MPISSTGPTIRTTGTKAGAGAGIKLPVSYASSQVSNWCWAACAEMIADYWGFSVTQCSMANTQLGYTHCCNSPTPGSCNAACPIPDVELVHTRNSVTCNPVIKSLIPEADLITELKASRPIELGFQYSSTSGHVVVVYGYASSSGINDFHVHDPDPMVASGLLKYNALKTACGKGVWNHTWTGF